MFGERREEKRGEKLFFSLKLRKLIRVKLAPNNEQNMSASCCSPICRCSGEDWNPIEPKSVNLLSLERL